MRPDASDKFQEDLDLTRDARGEDVPSIGMVISLVGFGILVGLLVAWISFGSPWSSWSAPTVLYDPPGNVRVSTSEIFGPVVCVYPYDDIDDAIARSNSLPYAFQASVFTSDIDTALRASRRLDASAVMVNDHPAFRVDWMPFAGLRESGIGVGGIPYTMEDMQINKLIVIRSQEL